MKAQSYIIWLCLFTALRSFTMLLRVAGSILTTLEIGCLIYLDDILRVGPVEEAPLIH